MASEKAASSKVTSSKATSTTPADPRAVAAGQELIESYLDKLERRFERLEDGTLLVAIARNQPPAAIRLAPPVVVLQVEIGKVPPGQDGHNAAFFRRLLELNANDLLHAAYGIEEDRVVLSSALELGNLDLNELEAVLADLDVALAEHVPELHQMAKGKA